MSTINKRSKQTTHEESHSSTKNAKHSPEDALQKRKELESELLIKSRAIESAVTGIGITDLEGKLTYVNRALLQMGGYEGAEVLGKHVSVFFKNDKEEVQEALKAVVGKGFWQGELEAKKKDRSVLDVMVWVNPVTDNSGKPVCLMASIADITERKRMEKAFEESQLDLKRAQAVAQTGSWRLDIQHNVLLWSDETHYIFGIPRGTTMTYETFLSKVHPDDREYVDKKWATALRGEEYDVEHRIVVGNEVKWVREKAELEIDQQGMLKGGFGTVQDITDRKKVEAELAHLASFPQLNPNPVLELDAAGNLKYLNPATTTHFPDLPTRGKNHPFLADWEALVKKIKSENLSSIISEVEIGDSWYEQTISCVPSSENCRLYARDITHRKKIDHLKDEFIGLVSHEMRTPLTVIIGAVHTAADRGLSPEERRELLKDAGTAAQNLADILENLLELTRYQADRMRLNKRAVTIAELAHKTIEEFRQQSSTHHIRLDIPNGLPQAIVDPVRFQRILHNLLENAIKYSPEGSEIRVFARQERGEMVVGVSDHGPGISIEDHQKLFEPFQRLETKSQAEGIGLGLVVCKRLVESHGGHIWVESRPGEGAIFLFTLPLAS